MGQFGFGFSHRLAGRRMIRKIGCGGRRRGRHTQPSKKRPGKALHLPAAAAANCSASRGGHGAVCTCRACTGKRTDSGMARFESNPGIGISRSKLKKRTNRLRHEAYKLMCESCRTGDIITLKKLLYRRAVQARSSGTDGLGAAVLNWNHRLSPLQIAAEAGQSDAVKLLVRCGARLDTVSSSGQTPLHAAAALNHTHVLKELLAGGASLDSGSSNWHFACVLIAKYVPHHWVASDVETLQA